MQPFSPDASGVWDVIPSLLMIVDDHLSFLRAEAHSLVETIAKILSTPNLYPITSADQLFLRQAYQVPPANQICSN